MAGQFIIDIPATFQSAFIMSSAPKLVFNSTEQQERDGTPRWDVQVAVTFVPQSDKAPAQSEVLKVTVTTARDPGLDYLPGTPVQLEGVTIGLNPAELKNDKIRGGKIWITATGLKSASASSAFARVREQKNEVAA